MRQEIYVAPVHCFADIEPSMITIFALDLQEALLKIEKVLKKTDKFVITNEIRLKDFTSNDYKI